MKNKIKTVFRRASYVLGAVVALAAILALYVEVDGIPRFPQAKTTSFEAAFSPARLERGKKIASLLCIDCHQNTETHALTGKQLTELPKEFGEIYSKNITRHPEMGIGKWTDGELAYFLRTGVRPDGQYVPPWMPKLPHFSDEDLSSLIVFLRSDDPLVAPSAAPPVGLTQPSFLSKALSHTVFGPLPYPSQPVIAPPRTDRVEYGKYVVQALDCFGCHSADFKSMNIAEPEKTPGYMGGGNVLVDADHKTIYSANLSPDDETGIGRWSEAEFIRAVRQGIRPDGRVLHYPMLPKAELDEDEVGAIYAYLRTVPKIKNAVVRPVVEVSAARVGHAGKPLYEKYGCGSCHGADGVGLVGDLRSANERYPSDEALRSWIEDAPKTKPGTRMPAFHGIIREDDYAPLMSYVRILARPGKEASK